MTNATIPDLAEYAAQARAWLRDNMPPTDPASGHFFLTSAHRSDEHDLARIATCRELQRSLFDGGYAGITVPVEYGGQGLTPAHQEVFNDEIRGYDYPAEIQASTFIPCMALLLEFGTEEQKLRHVPAMLRGDEVWVQLLSEPGGGSDAAGAVTTAARDGDNWRLNGSKIWTTGAWYGDWAMCLARTDWDADKHAGLTVFTLPIASAGVEIHRIELLNGSAEFCQEFLTDVLVPDQDRLGDIGDGWRVATRWLYHERTIAGGSQYVTGTGNRISEGPYEPRSLAELAHRLGTFGDQRVQELIGEVQTLALVYEALVPAVTHKISAGSLRHHAAALVRMFSGASNTRKATIAAELAEASSVAWMPDDEMSAQIGLGYLMRQAGCIGGGTTEMARNVVSERVLGMPREQRADMGAFRTVPRGPQASR
jgi:alkylation response protein AidB-like acyl-CoA dehydrogenase